MDFGVERTTSGLMRRCYNRLKPQGQLGGELGLGKATSTSIRRYKEGWRVVR